MKAGSRAVIATSDDDAYRVALDLHGAGVTVAAIADLRPSPDGEAVAAARAAGIRVLPGRGVCRTVGRLRIRAADLGRADGDGVRGERIDCDLLLMSGGWTPSVHLFSQSRGRLRYDEARAAFVPGESVQRERSAGACRGTYDLAACVGEGTPPVRRPHGWRGEAAIARRPAPAKDGPGPICRRLPRGRRSATAAGTAVAIGPAGRAFVDFQNDVTTKDIRLALREGFRSIEHVKRYTTSGMATDQGKTSNMNALGLVAAAAGKPVPEVGLTTFRMPYTPVTFGALAGMARSDLFDPVRQTPIHEWAAAECAVFENVGLWERARFFPRAGEDMHAAVARECRAVREQRRHLRRLHPRQDRGRRSRRRRIHEPALHQCLDSSSSPGAAATA